MLFAVFFPVVRLAVFVVVVSVFFVLSLSTSVCCLAVACCLVFCVLVFKVCWLLVVICCSWYVFVCFVLFVCFVVSCCSLGVTCLLLVLCVECCLCA